MEYIRLTTTAARFEESSSLCSLGSFFFGGWGGEDFAVRGLVLNSVTLTSFSRFPFFHLPFFAVWQQTFTYLHTPPPPLSRIMACKDSALLLGLIPPFGSFEIYRSLVPMMRVKMLGC